MLHLSLQMKSLFRILMKVLQGNKYFRYLFYADYKQDFYRHRQECFPVSAGENIAIVVQGPYLDDEAFTRDTLRRYRLYYPECLLILSTWSVPEREIITLQKINVDIVINPKPHCPGFSNVNYQIASTNAGVSRARNLGAVFVLKTRTDQRIHNPELFTYLISLQRAFPVTAKHTKQKCRLVACSLNTFKLRLYGISDMFLFGHVEDMIRYWDLPMDERNPDELARSLRGTWRDYARMEICEVYFCMNFLRNIGRKLPLTLESSFSAISDHFVIIDQNAIGLFWNKYTFDETRYSQAGQYDPQLTFNDWLVLYSREDDMTFNELLLDLAIGDSD